MLSINNQFEEEWTSLKVDNEYGSFEYSDSAIAINEVITAHFRKISRVEKYGVYILRQKNTHKVLYIGMSGRVDGSGRFKGQDIPGRLKNVKNNDMSAKEWFRNVGNDFGPITIEYIFLTIIPKAPAFVEATLIQAYLNSFKCLPPLNNQL